MHLKTKWKRNITFREKVTATVGRGQYDHKTNQKFFVHRGTER
jgi:hypothetical protein